MKNKKHIKSFNEATDRELSKDFLNTPDDSRCFSKKDLFEAFSYYAFKSISNKPYNEKELLEEFEKWFKRKYSR